VSGGAPKSDLARDETIQSDPSRPSQAPPRFQSGARVTERQFIHSGDVPCIDASGNMSSEGLPVRLGDVIAGKYQVERVLGRGGAGIVVLAKNLDLDEPVALKFLRPEVAELPEVVARFAREAKSAVSIKNEHVCKVLDVGTLPSGAPYMVMEYLEGRDLYRVMRERGALPVAEAVEYVLQACEALALAHARGIVHRDVKPENIFLIEPPEGLPYVKVLDFGISKGALTAGVNHDSIIKTGSLLGTPAYMSPEQIRATAGVDARTDIWALGIVLYEILTARAAFTADSVPQMAAAILEQEPESIRKIRVDIPPELAAVIGLCMSKDRNKRPADVAALASLLLPFAPKRARISVERAESVLHRTSSNTSGSRPPVSAPRRSRAPLAIIAAVVAAAIVIAIVVLTRKPAPIEVVVPPPPTVTVTVAGPSPPAVTVTVTTTVTAAPAIATTTAPTITKAIVKPATKSSVAPSAKSSVDLGF
jgi:eukaryotic-like serine/threonine-protein kinase